MATSWFMVHHESFWLRLLSVDVVLKTALVFLQILHEDILGLL